VTIKRTPQRDSRRARAHTPLEIDEREQIPRVDHSLEARYPTRARRSLPGAIAITR
jgi:hypothetical protein